MIPFHAMLRAGFLGGVMAGVFLVYGHGGLAAAQEKPVAKHPERVKAPALRLVVPEQVKAKVVETLYRGELGKRALFAHPKLFRPGTKIGSWKRPAEVTVEKESWFFFVDEQPDANWEHPAKYVLVDKATGAVRSFQVTTPPVDILDLEPLNPKAATQKTILKRNIRLTLPRPVIKPVRILKMKKYAVLVSGGANAASNYGRYWNDLCFIYKALKEKYKFTDTEIIVLYANGTHSPSGDMDGNGTNDIDYAATKANLTKVMQQVANNIAANGKFFFYSTNHGGQESGHDAYLWLWNEYIRDDELAALSKNIKCAEAIYVMEQCFSGGMMDDLLKAQTYPCSNPKVCVMTAARHDEVSYAADTEGQYDEYVYHWTSAVYGKNPTGTPVNADTNGDGVVSVSEAHDYAKSKDSRNEHPMIGSCITNACGTSLLSGPDLGMYGFLKIGKFKKEVKWNDTIVLTPADATLISGGKPAFEVYYSFREYNGMAASGFKNKIFFNNKLVSQQTNLSVGSKEIRTIHTQAYLGPENGKLQIKIDADNEVEETHENNNFNFFVNINLSGF